MIKNLTLRNQLILCLLYKRCIPTSRLRLDKELNLQSTFIKRQFNLINNISYQFASNYKKRPQRSESRQNAQKQSTQSSSYKKFQKIRPSQKQLREKQKQQNKHFTASITDPELYIDYINNKNGIEDATKLMNRILNTRKLTKNEFEMNVWKKYSYYVYLVGEKEQIRWQNENGIKGKVKSIEKESNQQYQQQPGNQSVEEEKENQNQRSQQSSMGSQKTEQNTELPDNHKIARLNKAKKLRLLFLSQITEIHQRFKGELQSQNVTKTFNKFVDFYFERQQWSTLTVSEKVSLLECVKRYNIKKAKTLFLKKRPSLFTQPKKQPFQKTNVGKQQQQSQHNAQSVIKVLDLMITLQISDTQLFQACIDNLYPNIRFLNLLQLQQLTYLLGKSHKFVNKSFLQSLSHRFNQLINQFDDNQIIKSLHILSSMSMIQKNMNLSSIYFEKLDVVYQRMLPLFDAQLMRRLKSKYLSTIASTLRRAQYFDQTVINSLIAQCISRQVFQFTIQQSLPQRPTPQQQFSTITLPQLTQIFFSLANFNYRHTQFMRYFLNILHLIQQSQNPQQYITYQLFSRLLWSICVMCNQKEMEKLLPLLQHFYKGNKQVEAYEATNYYYCYLLLKRKYMLSEIRFENDKIQQYLTGPKHQVQISQVQKQVHAHLLELGIPSLLEYNLNNLICDIYIPKFHQLEHIIIEIHGFHHFPRNTKKLNGATILKQKIIENQGYTCFYISLDQWLIAQDKEQFLKDFFNHILIKKHQEKINSKRLQESLKVTENIQKRGRRVLEFKRKSKPITPEIDNSQEKITQISDNKND